MQFSDLAFGKCDQLDTQKAKQLEECRNVLLITRKAVQGLGDNNVERSPPRVFKHRLIARAQ